MDYVKLVTNKTVSVRLSGADLLALEYLAKDFDFRYEASPFGKQLNRSEVIKCLISEKMRQVSEKEGKSIYELLGLDFNKLVLEHAGIE